MDPKGSEQKDEGYDGAASGNTTFIDAGHRTKASGSYAIALRPSTALSDNETTHSGGHS